MDVYVKGTRVSVPRGPAGPDGNPIGTIVQMIGASAPDGYLNCDGSEYSIGKYPHLANFIKQQFGTPNYFGGDGSSSFAVPDLSGEYGNLEEFDQDDWHVRKWANGYVEMTGSISKLVTIDEWTEVSSPNTSGLFSCRLANFGLQYPFPLTALFSETAALAQSNWTGWVINRGATYSSETDRNYSNQYGVIRWNKPTVDTTFTVRICVSGLWKPLDKPFASSFIKAVPSESPAQVYAYDTDEGWHVRKWPDGYVEMAFSTTVTVLGSAWGEWANDTSGQFGYFAEVVPSLVPQLVYPVPLTQFYHESQSVSPTNTDPGICIMHKRKAYLNTRIAKCTLWRPTIQTANINLLFSVMVTGRWKNDN